MAQSSLTAGEECQLAAKALSAFVDSRKSGAVPPTFINAAMALALLKGNTGVAVVRLASGEWSAPCAIAIDNPSGTGIMPAQETCLLFMTERSVLSLVSRSLVGLNQTHKFLPGPLNMTAPIDLTVDIYAYVRYNAGFTDSHLIQSAMAGWRVQEDPRRHTRWHGQDVTWFDVLTNKISVDRSSVGNALYVVLNLAAGQVGKLPGAIGNRKNFADLESLVNAPSSKNPHAASGPAVQQGGQPVQGGWSQGGQAGTMNMLQGSSGAASQNVGGGGFGGQQYPSQMGSLSGVNQTGSYGFAQAQGPVPEQHQYGQQAQQQQFQLQQQAWQQRAMQQQQADQQPPYQQQVYQQMLYQQQQQATQQQQQLAAPHQQQFHAQQGIGYMQGQPGSSIGQIGEYVQQQQQPWQGQPASNAGYSQQIPGQGLYAFPPQ